MLFFEWANVAIAVGPARFDEARLARRIVESLANRADGFSERVIVNIFASPEAFEQFGAADDAFAALDEIQQNLKRFVCKMDGLPVVNEQARLGLKLKFAEQISFAAVLLKIYRGHFR